MISFGRKAAFTPDTCSQPDTSIPDEQLVSGYKWIGLHVAMTTILSPIQDTCRRRQGIQLQVDTIQVDTTCIRATCIRCTRGITHQSRRRLSHEISNIELWGRICALLGAVSTATNRVAGNFSTQNYAM